MMENKNEESAMSASQKWSKRSIRLCMVRVSDVISKFTVQFNIHLTWYVDNYIVCRHVCMYLDSNYGGYKFM